MLPKNLPSLRRGVTLTVTTALALALTGCLSTAPKLGGSKNMAATGAAGGANSEGANEALETCEAPLGTVGLFEDRSLPWWSIYSNRYPQLGSTIPVLRLMVQQSNCFVVVERGAAMKATQVERELAASGELRSNSNVTKGQMVAADYSLSPSIQFAGKTGGAGAALAGALLGGAGKLIAGGLRKNEAATTLLMVDNRSSVQISAATGSATNSDFSLLGGIFGSSRAGVAGAYSRTPQGKLIIAAFTDSYNQMVKAVRNYEAQTVEGGLGAGGKLKVGN